MEKMQNLIGEENTIDLLEIFHLFLNKLKFIVLAAIIGALLVGGYTRLFVSPKYQATAQIYVVSASNDSVVNLSDLQIGTNLAADYKSLILCRPMMESVINNLNLRGMTAEQLKRSISVTNPSSTRILAITATSTDPVLSRDIANEVSRLSVQWLPEIMESTAPNIVEEAITPSAKSGPSLVKNAFIGALAFAIAYFAVCVIRYLLDDTVKTAEDMEHYFGVVPLASIPADSSISDMDKSLARKLKRGNHTV